LISERLKNVEISPTMKIAARAIILKSEGIDLVDFTVGEPDFPTPQFIKNAGKEAIDKDFTKYTINRGDVALRKAIVEKYKASYKLDYDIADVIISSGAKQSIYNTIMTLVNRGDEVIIPAPYWVSYPQMVKLAEGVPVFVETKEKNGFKLTPEELKNKITAKTRVLIICNPSNPAGTVYTPDELCAINSVLEGKNIFVISDEIYEKLVFDNREYISFAACTKNSKERTIIVNGVSKAYAMTGWRLGYAIGPREIIDGADIIQSHSTSNASSIAQYAALKALTGPNDDIEFMRCEFEKRRNYLYERIQNLPQISCVKPEGAFYAFPNTMAYAGVQWKNKKIKNDYDLAIYILEEANVSLMPGSAFGMDNFLRISYATSMQKIEEGMDRIEKALKNIAN
jgi:aspartate/methionine/tyrosine aminotransferase